MYLAFLFGSFNNTFFDCAFTNKTVDSDLFCLTKPVSPVHCLLVYSWIPVTVIKNYLQHANQVYIDASENNRWSFYRLQEPKQELWSSWNTLIDQENIIDATCETSLVQT